MVVYCLMLKYLFCMYFVSVRCSRKAFSKKKTHKIAVIRATHQLKLTQFCLRLLVFCYFSRGNKRNCFSFKYLYVHYFDIALPKNIFKKRFNTKLLFFIIFRSDASFLYFFQFAYSHLNLSFYFRILVIHIVKKQMFYTP